MASKKATPISDDSRSWSKCKFTKYCNVPLQNEITPEVLLTWAQENSISMNFVMGSLYASAYQLGVKQSNLDAELVEVTAMDMDEGSPTAGQILTCSANNIELAFIGLWYKHAVMLQFDWRNAAQFERERRRMM